MQFHPEVEEYKIYYAQSLYKAGIYADASKVAMSVDGAEHSQRMSMLQAAIKYEEDDVSACESLLSEGDATDADSLIGTACIRFKEGKTDEARAKFEEAAGILGWQASVAYGIALCHYQAGEYRRALELVGDIIERGVREHPELSVGSNTGGLDVSPARATAPARPLAMSLAASSCSHSCGRALRSSPRGLRARSRPIRAPPSRPGPSPPRVPPPPPSTPFPARRLVASATPRFCAKPRWWRRSTCAPPSSSSSETSPPLPKPSPTCPRGEPPPQPMLQP